MPEVMTIKFKCKKCATPFEFEQEASKGFNLPLQEIHCPKCNWSPQEVVEDLK